MTFRFSIGVANQGAARNTLTRQMAIKTRLKGQEAGRDMAREANALLASRTQSRPYERRRHPGSRRAVGSIDYQIEGGQDSFPIKLSYRILGGQEVFYRVIILNFGRGDSVISPSGAWPLTGVTNVVRTRRYKSRGRGSVLAFEDGGDTVFSRKVTSPGTDGLRFLEDARDVAVKRWTA